MRIFGRVVRARRTFIRRLGRVAAVPLAVAVSLPGTLGSAAPTVAQAEPLGPGVAAAPTVRYAEAFDVSAPLRDLVAAPPVREEGEEGGEWEPHPLPRPDGNVPSNFVDPALQTSGPSSTTPGPIRTFDGNSSEDNGLLTGAPPDTIGDIGPDHYVQWVNTVLSVYQRNGTRIYGPVPGNTIWADLESPNPETPNCAADNDGDPAVQYDQLSDRWMLSQFAFQREPFATGLPVPPFYQCIAVSATPDPTGPYYRYEFRMSNTKLNDYPHFGVWPDAYYMSINQFDATTGYEFAGAGAVAFERSAMLAGQPARMVYFDEESMNANYGGQLPSDLDGLTLPPAGSPNYFMQFDDSTSAGQDKILEFKFHVDWTNPGANSTFTFANSIPVADFDSNMCNFGNTRGCIPQKDGTAAADKLDSIPDRLMYRLAYRNFGDHESIVANHTVDIDASDHAGVRWYEIRDPGGSPSVFQHGTYAGATPDARHRWMGSIAMDQSGDIALGYSLSAADMYPALAYTGRLATDALGTMGSERRLFSGTGAQTGTSNRWGDYSSMNVDPRDDCTFWFTSEYYAATGSFNWRTRIGSFRFPGCGGNTGADLEIVGSDSPDPVAVGETLTYTMDVTNNGTVPASGVQVTDPLPSGALLTSATSSAGSCSGGPTVQCSLGALAVGETATITLGVAPPAVTGSVDTINTATVASETPDPIPDNNTAEIHTTVAQICSAPGATILTDASGDETGGNPAQDIRALSVAEPIASGTQRLSFTLEMADLSQLPPSTRWIVFFTAPNNSAYFVHMVTAATGPPSFQYGTTTVNTAATGGYYTTGTVTGTADAASNYNSKSGRITVQVPASVVGNPAAGQSITKFLVQISQSTPAGTLNVDFAPNGARAPAGRYQLRGNGFCAANVPPTAALTATPSAGDIPLDVLLDASGSTDPDSPIATYRFDFGDGTPGVTQQSAIASHRYARPGIFVARVVATDTFGNDSAPATARLDVGPLPPVTFAPATVIDAQRTEGEPLNYIDADGNYWESGPWGTHNQQSFIHRSVDGGRQFNIVSPVRLRPDPGGPGGGDTDVIVDDQGNAYFTDLEALAALDVAVSNDDGNTWRRNSVGQVLPGIDRQWFAVDNGTNHTQGAAGAADNTVFLAYHDASGIFVVSTPGSTGPTDPVGGLVYTPTSVGPIAGDARCGQLRFDPVARNILYPCAATGTGAAARHVRLSIAHVDVGQRTGLSYTTLNLPDSPGGGGVATQLFPVVATDATGTVYVAWVDSANGDVYYTWSKTPTVASSWKSPIKVSSGDANTNVMPWVQAGADGMLAVAWYGTSTGGNTAASNNPNNFPSWFVNRINSTNVKWYGYAAIVSAANTPTPAISQARFTDTPMDYGQICTSGTTCLADLGDRTLADFFGFSIDADGAMRIVFNDVSSQHHGAHLFEARQMTGPTVLGTVLDEPAPTNPVLDPKGDAQVPHYQPLSGAGPNATDYDFTRVRLSRPDADTLRVQMTMNDLSSGTPAPPGSDKRGVWLTRFQALSRGEGGEQAYRIFYVLAESDGAQVRYFAGSGNASDPTTSASGNGCVQTLPGAGAGCKIVQYPDEVALTTGQINGNVITIDVPIDGGFGANRPIQANMLHSVTAMTFGRNNDTADLYTDIDATEAFDYPLTFISGTVYNDANANGQADGGEHGLANVGVFLDDNMNGLADESETRTVTDSAGRYSFSGVPFGGQVVDYRVPEGFENTGAQPLSVDLTNGGASVRNDFFAAERTADIAVEITPSATQRYVRRPLGFTATVTNLGPRATEATLSDALPDGLVFASATPSQGSCEYTTSLACDLGTLASGESASVGIVTTTVISGPWDHTVRASGARDDPDSSNNSATAAVTVTGKPSCTIVGTRLDDTLVGTDGDDVICGVGGNDDIDGGGGRDIVFGMDGADVIRGGEGNDVLWNGPGVDVVEGQAGNDSLIAGRGNDSLDGGAGTDILWFSLLESATSGVTTDLGAGTSSGGGLGTDTIAVVDGLSTIEGVRGTQFSDTLTGDGGPNTLFGVEGNDTLSALDGNDVLYGGPDDDALDGGAGTDTCVDRIGTNTRTGCERRTLPSSASTADPWSSPEGDVSERR